MARMSIDDKVGRDPRITLLALALGWSKRELVGCLVLDVWPLCYDQESALVSERIIDAAAGHPGFATAMVEAELASRDRSGRLRITGAAKRIAYLDHQKKHGREGGLKSAKLRANESKGTSRVREASLKGRSRVGQGSGNPSVPDVVPDSASASASAPDVAPVPDAPVSRPPATKATGQKGKHKRPDGWKPNETHTLLAAELKIADLGFQATDFVNHHDAKGNTFKDWDLAFGNWLRRAVSFGTAGRTTGAGNRDLRYGRASGEHTQEERDADYERLRREAPRMTGDAP